MQSIKTQNVIATFQQKYRTILWMLFTILFQFFELIQKIFDQTLPYHNKKYFISAYFVKLIKCYGRQ